jgi:hypothetical protein
MTVARKQREKSKEKQKSFLVMIKCSGNNNQQQCDICFYTLKTSVDRRYNFMGILCEKLEEKYSISYVERYSYI